jgi:hypothetical protein
MTHTQGQSWLIRRLPDHPRVVYDHPRVVYVDPRVVYVDPRVVYARPAGLCPGTAV